jgi:anti-anti-sigma regulatory factor
MQTELSAPSVLRAGRLKELHEALCHALEAGSVRLDVTEVGKLDFAGLQLIIAAATEARRREVGFELAGPCSILQDALEVVGAQDLAPIIGGGAA